MALFVLVKRKILRQKNCYLLTKHVKEIANLHEIYCVKGKVDDNKKIKSFLLKNFQENLRFTSSSRIHRNPIVVHSKEVWSVNFAMISIVRIELSDKEITLAFEKMMKP